MISRLGTARRCCVPTGWLLHRPTLPGVEGEAASNTDGNTHEGRPLGAKGRRSGAAGKESGVWAGGVLV